MNVIAIIAARNEELTIGRCCRHLAEQGLRFVVIDNDSTDGTRDIVESFRGQGLIDVVRFPYPGQYDWIGLLKCKERLARELDGDWFMHLDADEIPEGGPPGTPLLERLREVDRAGCNAVNFDEFTFVPATETERHEGTDYVTGMRRYYFFAPRQLRLIRLWRKAAEVNLSGSGGHNAVFTNRRLYPENFRPAALHRTQHGSPEPEIRQTEGVFPGRGRTWLARLAGEILRGAVAVAALRSPGRPLGGGRLGPQPAARHACLSCASAVTQSAAPMVILEGVVVAAWGG